MVATGFGIHAARRRMPLRQHGKWKDTSGTSTGFEVAGVSLVPDARLLFQTRNYTAPFMCTKVCLQQSCGDSAFPVPISCCTFSLRY